VTFKTDPAKTEPANNETIKMRSSRPNRFLLWRNRRSRKPILKNKGKKAAKTLRSGRPSRLNRLMFWRRRKQPRLSLKKTQSNAQEEVAELLTDKVEKAVAAAEEEEEASPVVEAASPAAPVEELKDMERLEITMKELDKVKGSIDDAAYEHLIELCKNELERLKKYSMNLSELSEVLPETESGGRKRKSKKRKSKRRRRTKRRR